MSTELETRGVTTEVAARLRDLYVQHDELRADVVVSDAADPASPLHAHFEWDDTEAARQHRLNQAAALIRKVKIQIVASPEARPIQVRAYVSRSELSAESQTGVPGSYLPIERVAGRTADELNMREAMKADVERLRRKYLDWEQFLEVAAELLE